MASQARIAVRRSGKPGPRGGNVYIPAVQRTRLSNAAVAVVAEQGYRRMTVRRVSALAGVSTKTFYDLFSDREDCFLAAFDYAVDELAVVVLGAYEAEGEWAERIRAGLGALLASLDEESTLCRLVFVEALGVGPRVLARRAEVLEGLASLIDEGRVGERALGDLPPLTAEGIVGAVFGVIYARLIQPESESLAGLLNPLMATIVLPYRGHAAAARELECPVPELRVLDASRVSVERSPLRARSASVDFRITQRRYRALAAVASLTEQGSNPSNREVSEAALIPDQSHISHLMVRLQEEGLVANIRNGQGPPKAWCLTPQGEEVLHASSPLSERAA